VFVGALALHAGFQVTVTFVVYPALAAVPADGWRAAHAAHARRITPVVVVVYAGALAVCAAALVHPGDLAPVPLAVAAAGTLAATGLTATLAGPLHSRLQDRDPALVRRLLLVDRLRCAAAALAAVAGVWSVA
jgi:hypothetical protein